MERAGGDGFCGIPDEVVGDGVRCAAQALDAEIVVVDEALMLVGDALGRIGWVGDGLDVFDTTAHMVVGHEENCLIV